MSTMVPGSCRSPDKEATGSLRSTGLAGLVLLPGPITMNLSTRSDSVIDIVLREIVLQSIEYIVHYHKICSNLRPKSGI